MEINKRSKFAFIAALLFMWAVAPHGQTIMPAPKFIAFDNNGDIVPSGKLCTYAAGTTTPLATYSDSGLTTPNTNPVVMDSAGRATVYLSATSYKFTLLTAGTDATCSTGTQLWSQDNISAVPVTAGNVDILCTAGETITAGQAVYWSDGSGGNNAGQCYKADSANTYSSTTNPVGFAPSAITSGSIGTVRIGGQVTGLTVSLGSLYYVGTAGAITTTAPTNKHLLGIADSTSSLILAGPSILETVPVNRGGTSLTTLTANNVILGNGASAPSFVAPSTSGNVLTSNGTTWTSAVPTGGYKIGNFTYDISTASGTQAVTGVGFRPRMVIFTSNLAGGTVWSVGLDDGTNTVVTLGGVSGGSIPAATSFSIVVGVDTGNFQDGKISAFGSDGFTVTWTKVGAPVGTATMGYYAFQ